MGEGKEGRMGRIRLGTLAAIFCAWGLAFGGLSASAEGAKAQDPKTDALSWQKQASDTRATVMDVAAKLDEIGDQGNVAARGMIEDAKRWVGEGDKQTAVGDAKFGAGDYAAAKNAYSGAWNDYVRAATSGLNARRILTGE
jgi:hypothetical protein